MICGIFLKHSHGGFLESRWTFRGFFVERAGFSMDRWDRHIKSPLRSVYHPLRSVYHPLRSV